MGLDECCFPSRRHMLAAEGTGSRSVLLGSRLIEREYRLLPRVPMAWSPGKGTLSELWLDRRVDCRCVRREDACVELNQPVLP